MTKNGFFPKILVCNDNGDQLSNFMCKNSLYAANARFKHKSRHRTTWTGYIKDGQLEKVVTKQSQFLLKLTLCYVKVGRRFCWSMLVHMAVLKQVAITKL